MSVKPGDTVAVQFVTRHPYTGALTNADALPVGTLVRNGANTAVSVTVANVATGVYSASTTIGAYAAGDVVQIRIAATVDGVAGGGIIWQDTVDTKRVSELADLTAQNARDAMKLAPSAGAPAGGSVDGHLDDIQADTDDLQIQIGVAGTGLTAIIGGDGDTLETLSDQLDVAQADLDNPNQYKADVSGLATTSEIVSALMQIPLVKSALQANDLTMYRGDTWIQLLGGLGDLSAVDDVQFAVKRDKDDLDSASVILISYQNGLVTINGRQADNPANGTINILPPAAAGQVRITLEAEEVAKVDATKRLHWDIQKVVGVRVTTPKAGYFLVNADVVRGVEPLPAICWTVGVSRVDGPHPICGD